jgi:hypothetical protein
LSDIKELSVSPLKQRYDFGFFNFKDTHRLDDLEEPLGRGLALEAIRFGTGVRH